MSKTIIAAADAATTVIMKHWDRASDILGRGIDYNGAGVLYDKSRTLDEMLEAKAQLEAAIAVHRATQWPRSADYEAAEEEARRDWQPLTDVQPIEVVRR